MRQACRLSVWPRTSLTGLVLLVLSFHIGSGLADPVTWRVANGGNGHQYQVVKAGQPISWAEARAHAQSLGPGWDLATITSADEDAFVTSLFANDPGAFSRGAVFDPYTYAFYGGPWLGAARAETASSLSWISGEASSYWHWTYYALRSGGSLSYGKVTIFGRQYGIGWTTVGWLWPLPVAFVAEFADDQASELKAELTLEPPETTACSRVLTAKIAISRPAPAGGQVVALVDDLANATVPASVTITEGETKASFVITVDPVATPQSGTIEASVAGVHVSAPLTIKPIRLASLDYATGIITGGGTTTGTVKLECYAAPGPVTVSLTSSDPSVATPVAASIAIPQGMLSQTLEITSNPVTARANVLLTATAAGSTVSRWLLVDPPAAPPTPTPSSQVTLSPLRLDFGRVVVRNLSEPLTAVVTNQGQADALLDVGITGSYAALFVLRTRCPTTLPPGGSCAIGVSFRPILSGLRTATLSVSSSGSRTPLTVQLSGTGVWSL